MSLELFKRRASKNWYIRGTIRGISVFESTRVAERSAAEAIRIQREKALLEESIFGRKATATFIEAAVMYMEHGGERRFVGPTIDYFGTRTLARIDQMAIDDGARAVYPKASNDTRVRQWYGVISAILNHAADRGLCSRIRLKRPPLSKGRVRYLTVDEAERLIEMSAPHLRCLLIFLFGTGARVSEALYLDWRQVDLERRQVRFLKTKNGQARGVPLHPRLVGALSALSHREGAVFRTNDGEPYSKKGDGGGQIKSGFNGACRRAGINDFRPHDCRHTWASWLYAATRNIPALMALGGWQSERMVMRYCHANVEHLASVTAALPWTTDPKVVLDLSTGSRGRADD